MFANDSRRRIVCCFKCNNKNFSRTSLVGLSLVGGTSRALGVVFCTKKPQNLQTFNYHVIQFFMIPTTQTFYIFVIARRFFWAIKDFVSSESTLGFFYLFRGMKFDAEKDTHNATNYRDSVKSREQHRHK